MRRGLLTYVLMMAMAMLAIVGGSVAQYHHHAINESICLCFTPNHHCVEHHHHCEDEDDDSPQQSTHGHDHKEHHDPGECSAHIAQVILEDHEDLSAPEIYTLLACLVAEYGLQEIHDNHSKKYFTLMLLPYTEPERLTNGLRAPPAKI